MSSSLCTWYNPRQLFRLNFGAQCLRGIVFYSMLLISFRSAMESYRQQRMSSFWHFIF